MSILGTEMDDEFCRERARTVRSVAEKADLFIKRRLLQLAQNYERRIGRKDGDDIRDEKKPEASPSR
jgi:hypothetical protein